MDASGKIFFSNACTIFHLKYMYMYVYVYWLNPIMLVHVHMHVHVVDGVMSLFRWRKVNCKGRG